MKEKTRFYLDRDSIGEAYDLVGEIDCIIPNLARKETLSLDNVKNHKNNKELYIMKIVTRIDTVKKEVVQDVYVG